MIISLYYSILLFENICCKVMDIRFIKIISVLSCASLIASCGRKDGDWDACGQVDAVKVTVSAETSGKIISLSVGEGSVIEKGTRTAVIDSVQVYLQKEELVSRRNGARTRIVDADLQLRAQNEQLKNLRTDLRRYEALLARDAGTAKQVDDIKSQISVLEGQLAAQKKTYKDGNAGVANEISTYNVQIAKAEDQLKKCRVISPISGTVLTKFAEEGEMIASGQPLYEIADMDNVFVRAYLSTSQLAGVRLGDKVRVIPDDGTSFPREYEGVLTWISEQSEFTPKNIQTKDERADLVYAVKVSVRNDGFLRLGMYAYIKL